MAPHMQELTTEATRSVSDVVKRLLIPLTPTSPPGLVQADTVDPWSKAGKYGLGWTYFAAALSGCIFLVRMWHIWQDKIRQAIYKQQVETHYQETYNVDSNFVQAAIRTGMAQEFFPDGNPMGEKFRPKAHFSSIGFVNDTLALFRWVFYRSVPDIVIGKHRFTFSSLSVLATTFIAFAFVTLYTFLQQPLYWESIRFGAPPVAIRAGMLSVALTPWIIATGMKTNILTMLLGIGPERLNVFHRWLSYLCLFLSLVHMIPFYVQPVWEDNGMSVWGSTFPPSKGIIYGTGIACIVPLLWLNVASLPWIRRVAYEAFVILHVPVGILYVGVLFWHTANRLLTWDYLYATVAIWGACNILRVFKLNWAWPGRLSFMVGDEAAITLMAENAIKVTIPTQMRWKPGQYVYLRMPGISFFDNHPFTISSLCSEDFPSEYGENYRDCILLFKAYGGFTRKVLDTAIEKGPFHTYRAFLDGPYGGMRRDLAAFDTCILIAGGSGITSLISQLLNLVKRMRDGKAITRKVVVVWAMKKFEDMDWFREELRICRESAPPESVSCKFFVTTAVRNRQGQQMTAPINGSNTRVLTHKLHDKLDGFVAGIASKRNSAFIQAEAQGDPERERELRAENEDRITALPQQKYLQPHQYPPPPPLPHPSSNESPMSQGALSEDNLGNLNENGYPEDKKQHDTPPEESEPQPQPQPIAVPELAHLYNSGIPAGIPAGPSDRPVSTFGPPAGFDFGFPQTPTEFQKNLMRSAFPMPHQITEDGWTIEYGRPSLGYMLKQWATGGPEGRGILGRRTAVFVCGPPGMRVGVANTVAKLQAEIWGDDELEEIFLHTENYAL